MNTWVVGHAPVGHYELKHPKFELRDDGVHEIGQKTFFMKARIMAGQANLEQNKLDLKEFKWLAKEEIAKTVSPGYFAAIKNMLPER
jgi:large subunit ribosomal protein L46